MPDSVSLTVQDVAELLNVNPRTVYRLVKSGGIPCFRVGSQWRFRKTSIKEWIKKSESRMLPKTDSERTS